ncbi:MAG: hypothetical protein WD733_05680 [Bryobacterales bacterium]
MTDIKNRLERSAAVLAVIDYRRECARDGNIGCELERFILDRELRELAGQSMAAPLGPAVGSGERKHRSV